MSDEKWTEAQIIIGDQPLAFGESMTLRVSVTTYWARLKGEGLGEDKHGIAITEGHMKNCELIIKKIDDSIRSQDARRAYEGRINAEGTKPIQGE